MIEFLEKIEENELDEWLELNSKKQTKILRSIAEYTYENKSAIQEYCLKTKPKELSSLSVIYEALSVYSSQFSDFLFSEIQRIINLARENKTEPENLTVLEDIEMEDVYEKEYSIYKNAIDFLTSSLSHKQTQDLNLAILSVIDYYLIDADEEEDDYPIWKQKLEDFASNGSNKIKDAIDDIYNFDSEKVSLNNSLNSKTSKIMLFTFFAGLLAQIIAVSYFRKTVIDTSIVAGIYLGTALIGFLLFKKTIVKWANNISYGLIYSICAFGGIAVLLFLFSNFQYATTMTEKKRYKIIEKSSLAGSKGHRSERKPTIYFNYKGNKKEQVYPYGRTEEVNNARYIEVETAKGLWGFDVIKNNKLINELNP